MDLRKFLIIVAILSLTKFHSSQALLRLKLPCEMHKAHVIHYKAVSHQELTSVRIYEHPGPDDSSLWGLFANAQMLFITVLRGAHES